MLLKNLNDIAQIEDLKLSKNDVTLVLASEKSKELKRAVCERLSVKGHEFFGGYFPKLIHNFQEHEEGVVLRKVENAFSPILFKDLNADISTVRSMLSECVEAQSYMIWVDGLSPHINTFLKNIYAVLGSQVSYIGGGAGSLSLQPFPCVFGNEGDFVGAAMVLPIKSRYRTSVKHGWKPISEEMIATHVEGNTIYKINWRSAVEVYKEKISKLNSEDMSSENFFSISKNFPFGLTQERDEPLVRDPIILNEDGSITCVGNIPKGAKLQVMTAQLGDLTEAASTAAQNIGDHIGGSPIIIDCISRAIFMDQDFQKELSAVSEGFDGSHGVLSLGEITSSSNGLLNFYNKTFVIGVEDEQS